MHLTRAYFHKQERSEKTPHLPLGRDAHKSVPHRWVSQVETPRSPIGAFPVFSPRSRLPAVGSTKSKSTTSKASKSTTSKGSKSTTPKATKSKAPKSKPAKSKTSEVAPPKPV